MARMSLRPRGRRPREACGDDRLSALPDDLLLLVLRRLDTRAALATGMLSRRWANLPHELDALDFRVSDILPPRYHRCILRHRGVMNWIAYRHAIPNSLMPAIRRHERRAARALVRSVESFIDADDGRPSRRKVSRLRLEFFGMNNTAGINRLISKAIDDWGVEELEAVGKPMYWRQPPTHEFPSHGLCKDPRASRLRTLTLGGCVLPPLHEYGGVTKLVLHGMAASTPAEAYEGVFTSCPQLQVLHLESCFLDRRKSLVVDAPMSEIRELVVDACDIISVKLRSLPRLQNLASMGTQVLFDRRTSSSSFPCLRQWHLAYLYGLARKFSRWLEPDLTLDRFFHYTLDITDLIVRFTGPERWIVPSSCSPSPPLLRSLRRLLVADMPSSWDASWPSILLDAAPSLKTLHIHIAPRDAKKPTGGEFSWHHPTVPLHNYRLEEFAMAGFGGTMSQVYFVKLVVGACTALRHVSIFKGGDLKYKGNWDWEMPRLQENSWNDKEKETMEKQIMDAVSCSTDHLQIVLG